MATHRSGTSPNQWPVGDLLRREGRSWPELSPSARGLAVGGALVCTTVVAVSMAAEPEEPETPAVVDPLPTPAAAPEPAVEPPVVKTPPPADLPQIVAAPPPLSPVGSDGPAAAVAPEPTRSSSRVPDAPRPGRLVPGAPAGEVDDGPVDGDSIVAETLDPPSGRHVEHDGDTDHRGDREPAAPVRSARDNAEKRTGKSARAKVVRNELERVKPKRDKRDRVTAKPATNGPSRQDRDKDRTVTHERDADEPVTRDRDADEPVTHDRDDDRADHGRAHDDRNERKRAERDRDDEQAEHHEDEHDEDEHDRGTDDDSADHDRHDDGDSADGADRHDGNRDDRDSADRNGCEDDDSARDDHDDGDSVEGESEHHDESDSGDSDEDDRDPSESRHAAAR